jgi:xylulokinase
MSLLGIDVGTSGCKAAVFSTDGRLLASAYREYDIGRPQPGWAELDAARVWDKIRETIAAAVARSGSDPVTDLSVSSMGEAVVPVGAGREVLGPSLLNFDVRGAEYLEGLRTQISDEDLSRLSGNPLGNHYSLTKLMWIRAHQPDLYARADKFLHWSSFVAFMLGADPVLDYSLANRTLLFDVDRRLWSDEMLGRAGLDREKLPGLAPSGTAIGTVSKKMAAALGLPQGVRIHTGAHDQVANAVGCGVIAEGLAVYGMGTYLCITPVFRERRPAGPMLAAGLTTEHHAVPGNYVCFIYNQGGALLKWYRDTFAAGEARRARDAGEDVYADLLAEMPAVPSRVLALPDFIPTGPPAFLADSCGALAGLHLETSRGEILKGLLEATTFYLRDCVEALPATGIRIDAYRAVGGGSKSPAWIQICADILGRPFVRPAVTEAGTLGAAIMAGVGGGVFPGYAEGAAAMVRLERTFEPDPGRQARYAERFEQYRRLAPLLREYLKDFHTSSHK